MYFWNRSKHRREARAAEQAREDTKVAQAAEQYRLGNILYNALEPVAAKNTQVAAADRIYATRYEKNAGNDSTIIMLESGSHKECMMQFDINVAKDTLRCGGKYSEGPAFSVDCFDEFLETAIAMVRDFV